MQTHELIELMGRGDMHRAARSAARRFTKCPEDIEEYLSDIWMKIANEPPDKTDEYYKARMKQAARAAYMRRYRSGDVYMDVNGISEKPIAKRIPRNAICLGHGKYLKYKPEKLSRWYYDGEWRDYGLNRDNVQVMTFYEIVALST